MAIVLEGKFHDLGGLTVTRVLPNAQKRMVGPFIFFDHMGPSQFQPGQGIDVRPHPHIGLCTITYLFEGAQVHRDSLGNHADVLPGDVNFMTAGRGIVHSERENIETRSSSHSLNGLQCWVALPKHHAEVEPSFTHVAKNDLPCYMLEGVMMRLLAGEAYGMSSPLKTYSPLLYIDAIAQADAVIELPTAKYDLELAIYVIEGDLTIADTTYKQGSFVLLDDLNEVVRANSFVRFVMVGGEAFSEIPHIEWNFVSFSKERIEQAKDDWRNGKFASIPSDAREHIPY